MTHFVRGEIEQMAAASSLLSDPENQYPGMVKD